MSKSTLAAPIGIRDKSPSEKLAFLKNLMFRSEHLVQGPARSTELCAAFDAAIKNFGNEDGVKDSLELQRRAYQDRLNGNFGSEANMELNAYRITTTDNFITAGANGLSFFEQVTLADNEMPLIENKTRHQIAVTAIGQDGGVLKDHFLPVGAETTPNLAILTTPDFEYTIWDLRKGDVRDTAFANVDMALDMTMKLNGTYWALAKTAIGNFGLSGKKESRVYVPHSSINTNNLPTTNLLVPASGNTTSSKWRLDCVKLILQYEAKWEGVMFSDGVPLRAQVVYIPSSDTTGLLDAITETSTDNVITRQLAENVFSVTLMGRTIMLMGDATLNPNDGLAYVRFNKSIGEYYSKPSADRVWVDDSMPLRKLNKESMSMTKAHGGALISNRKMNIAAVRYRTAS